METVESLIERALRRSATDADFRERLVANPTEALEEIARGALPRLPNVRFVAKPQGIDALYVLPALVARDALSDEALEAIAGGAGDTCAPETCASSSALGP